MARSSPLATAASRGRGACQMRRTHTRCRAAAGCRLRPGWASGARIGAMTEAKGYDPEVYVKAAEQRGLDLDALACALATTLARRLGVGDVTVDALRIPEGAGTSSGTVLFSATWNAADGDQRRDLVARTQPDKVQLFREPDFRKQYVVIDALYRSGRVKVAEAVFFEDDPSIIGVPFFVMSQLKGRVPVSFPGYNVEGF